MESWTARPPQALPGHGPALRLFDTASGLVRATQPGPTARMYVCGITPYDATHMGHAATYVAFDLVNRYWRDLGHEVHYVQNVTDVDDPLLERAVATGRDWRELARAETALFGQDMAALGVLPPRNYVGAVESIGAVVRWIERLRSHGAVYRLGNDLYFDTRAAPSFGRVSGLDASEMLATFAERGGDPDRPGKRSPLDCVLWLAERPDEPAWDTPLGHGRPGWHIECTAIALDHLGAAFDVQGGGSDLAFPHHEMCSAQAHAATDRTPFAGHYVHTGMVGFDGEKMSKSRGNLVFVSRLRAAGVEPTAIRLALLGHGYRQDWEWTDADLAAAQSRVARWRAALAVGEPAADGDGGPATRAGDSTDHTEGPADCALLAGVRERLADDLDAPGALEIVDRWADRVLANDAPVGAGTGLAEPIASAALVGRALDTLLGVDLL